MGRSTHKLSKQIYFLKHLKKKMKKDKKYNTNFIISLEKTIVELENQEQEKKKRAREYMAKVYKKIKNGKKE